MSAAEEPRELEAKYEKKDGQFKIDLRLGRARIILIDQGDTDETENDMNELLAVLPHALERVLDAVDAAGEEEA